MAIARRTILLLSVLLISKCITVAWSNMHSNSIHALHKRSDELGVEADNKVYTISFFFLTPILNDHIKSAIISTYNKTNAPMCLNTVWTQHLAYSTIYNSTTARL